MKDECWGGGGGTESHMPQIDTITNKASTVIQTEIERKLLRMRAGEMVDLLFMVCMICAVRKVAES